MTDHTLCARILRAMTDRNGTGDDKLWWRIGPDGELRFTVDVSDRFAWGTADCEDVPDLDAVAALEAAREDLCAASPDKDATDYTAALYTARRRQERPQGAVYAHMPSDAVRALFDACGPARDVTLTNPVQR
jgi:hypothetical protein